MVICENMNFKGEGEDYLRQRGVEVVNLNVENCKELMAKFIKVCLPSFFLLLEVYTN